MKAFIVDKSPPSYLSLTEQQWAAKITELRHLSSPCRLCPRQCQVLRLAQPAPGALGICQTADRAVVASSGPHFGEEPPLVGLRGSGTIFFTNCSLGCMYCQNYTIAHLGQGRTVSDDELAQTMLSLQERGCHNINLVTPSHVVANIVAAVHLAAGQGLKLPLVYNTGGYDSLATLRQLEGVIDIYMPDLKYADAEPAAEFSQAPDYPEISWAAVREMQRQVGDLVVDRSGVAVRGLLIRLLVLPGGLAGTEKIMNFIARHISKDAYINLMAQYRPCFEAVGHPVLGRPISRREYREAVDMARRAGLRRVQTD